MLCVYKLSNFGGVALSDSLCLRKKKKKRYSFTNSAERLILVSILPPPFFFLARVQKHTKLSTHSKHWRTCFKCYIENLGCSDRKFRAAGF